MKLAGERVRHASASALYLNGVRVPGQRRQLYLDGVVFTSSN
jgi:hypothetical protein